MIEKQQHSNDVLLLQQLLLFMLFIGHTQYPLMPCDVMCGGLIGGENMYSYMSNCSVALQRMMMVTLWAFRIALTQTVRRTALKVKHGDRWCRFISPFCRNFHWQNSKIHCWD